MKTYKVLRAHHGDKPYVKGDTREAAPSDVAHLLRLGVLAEEVAEPPPPPQQDTKAEPAPLNKVEKASANKAGA